MEIMIAHWLRAKATPQADTHTSSLAVVIVCPARPMLSAWPKLSSRNDAQSSGYDAVFEAVTEVATRYCLVMVVPSNPGTAVER